MFTVVLAFVLAGSALVGCGGDRADAGAASSDAALVAPVGNETIAQIGGIFMGAPLDDTQAACVADGRDSDPNLAVALNVVAGGTQPVSEGQFTVLVGAVRDCVGQDAFNGALAGALAYGSDPTELHSCLDTTVTGDRADPATVGLAGVVMQFGLPDDAKLAAVAALTACVSDELLTQQLATSFEVGQNYKYVVDRDCLGRSIATDDTGTSFWEASVNAADASALDAYTALVSDCASRALEGFEPWSGTRALAALNPLARVDAYDAPPPMVIDPAASYTAVITTTDGAMRFELFAGTAPVTVNNFVALARDGYFDGTSFHRVIEGFMAQGGDPSGTGSGGPGYAFADETEARPELAERGLLAMANAGPDTNGSQFFITFAPTEWLNGKHTVFGRLVEGDDVLAQIDVRDPAAPTGPGETIVSVEITEG